MYLLKNIPDQSRGIALESSGFNKNRDVKADGEELGQIPLNRKINCAHQRRGMRMPKGNV